MERENSEQWFRKCVKNLRQFRTQYYKGRLYTNKLSFWLHVNAGAHQCADVCAILKQQNIFAWVDISRWGKGDIVSVNQNYPLRQNLSHLQMIGHVDYSETLQVNGMS